MTNLEYIQMLSKETGLEFLRGVCPRHPCHDCEFEHDGEACQTFTAGADELAEWLFAEREEEKKDKRGAGTLPAPIDAACCGNCRWMTRTYEECLCEHPEQNEGIVYSHYVCDLFERSGEVK